MASKRRSMTAACTFHELASWGQIDLRCDVMKMTDSHERQMRS